MLRSWPSDSTTRDRGGHDAVAAERRCSGRTPTTTSSSRAPRRMRRAVRGAAPARPGAAPATPSALRRRVRSMMFIGGRADEAGDEEVRRPLVDLLRRADLLERAVGDDRDAVAHRHRLDLVVRHVHDGGLQPRCSSMSSARRLHPQLRVEVRQRLVHEERLRDGARSRRASATRWRCPPESCAGLRSSRSLEAERVGRVLHELGRARRRAPCAGSSAGTRCCAAPSCADRARSSGTPSRRRGPSARRRSRSRRRSGSCPRSGRRDRRSCAARSTSRSPTGRAARGTRGRRSRA